MKAAAYHGLNDLRIEELDNPSCSPGEILLRVKACAICATDVKTVLKGHALIKPPAVLGHEISGEVVQVGDGTEGFNEGDRVAVGPYAPCGHCYYCLRGQHSICENLFGQGLRPGGFSEYVAVSPNIVRQCTVKISTALSFEEASMVEPLACCLKGLRLSCLSADDTVVILGCGPVGLMHLLLCQALGVHEVVMIDPDETRRQIASEFGAELAVNPSRDDVRKAVITVTEGRGADIVMVDTPAQSAVRNSFDAVRKGGTICIFAGMPSEESTLPVDLNMMHYSEVRLTGSFGYTPEDFHRAHRMLQSRKVRLDLLITHRVKLDQIVDAINLIHSRKALRVVVLPGD